jgi:hypothetical protein
MHGDAMDVLVQPFLNVDVVDGRVTGVTVDWHDTLRHVFTPDGETIDSDTIGPDTHPRVRAAYDAVGAWVDDPTRRAAILAALNAAPAPEHTLRVREDGTVECSCGSTDFTYEESHPSSRSLASNGDGTLAFYGDFEWFDGDDTPGVECGNGHHPDTGDVTIDYV